MHDTIRNVFIHQQKYPLNLYKSEVRSHEFCIHEYESDILDTMLAAMEAAAPNINLYNDQPYLKPAVRFRLVDFLLKMLVRLKLLPFVFYRAVALFDRYCLKRIVLLDQAQLIITTCLWMAAKIKGGNNHFANMTNGPTKCVYTIADLGYGSGGRFQGPTQRYRMPKVNELIKLCGSRCNYDSHMFKQMEMHIMDALDWRFNDPCIEEFMVCSHEFKVTEDDPIESHLGEFFKMKEFVAYASCYVYDLVGYSPLQVAGAIVDLVNRTFSLPEHDIRFQMLNHSILEEAIVDSRAQRDIQNHLVHAIVNAPPYLMQVFSSPGPHLLHQLVAANYRPIIGNSYSASMALESSSAGSSVFSGCNVSSNYSSASLTPSSDEDPKVLASEPSIPTQITSATPEASTSRRPSRATPDVDHPPLNLHHYLRLNPLACPTSNNSQVSLRSASAKDQIFDSNPGVDETSTPMSIDDECKDTTESEAKH